MAASEDKSFLDSPALLEESELPYNAKGTTFWPGEDNTLWYLGSDERLHQIDDELLEQSSIHLDCNVNDICTNPMTFEMFCCSPDENSVRSVDTNSGKTNILFNTENDPLHILCTYNKQLVVAMAESVCMFSFEGKLLHDYEYDSGDITALSISEETNYIALAMASSRIVVLDDELNKDYEYLGDLSVEPTGDEDEKKPLNYNSCIFVDRYLIASDKNNQGIHVLNGDEGTFIHSISVDGISDALAIGVQKDNNVLVVGSSDPSPKVISIRYADSVE